MNKQLSIIIVTYNSQSIISDCLLSITKFNDIGDALEVIIVDNNSTDQQEVFEIAQGYQNLQIEWISNPANSGYGAGNNIGVRKATAPHVLIMNPDVRLVAPVFNDLLALFEAQKQLAMVGVSFTDKSSTLYLKPEYYSLFNLLFENALKKIGAIPFNHLHMSGSFLLFNREYFLEAGGFDDQVFLFFEEADITNRLLKNGRTVQLAKDIMVYHLTHQRRYNPTLLNVYLNSMEYYIKKYNLNRTRILNNYLVVNKLKYIVAVLMRNPLKTELFKGWITQLNQRLA